MEIVEIINYSRRTVSLQTYRMMVLKNMIIMMMTLLQIKVSNSV